MKEGDRIEIVKSSYLPQNNDVCNFVFQILHPPVPIFEYGRMCCLPNTHASLPNYFKALAFSGRVVVTESRISILEFKARVPFKIRNEKKAQIFVFEMSPRRVPQNFSAPALFFRRSARKPEIFETALATLFTPVFPNLK